jgi:hypothetical protein
MKNPTCSGFGFHPDTDAFASCLQKENLARQALTSYPTTGVLGLGLLGTVVGAVLALAGGSAVAHPNVPGAHPQHPRKRLPRICPVPHQRL